MMDYDPVRNRMLTYGGIVFLSSSGEAWALTLDPPIDWTPLRGGPAINDAAHVYDPVGDRWVVFGGATHGTPRNSTQVLSLGSSAGQWNTLAPSGPLPSARVDVPGVYDPLRHRLIVFGGREHWSSSTHFNDAHALDFATTTWSPVAAAGSPPSARRDAGMILDAARDRVVVFGGRDASTSFGDVWLLSLSGTPTWSPMATSGTPPSARSAMAAVYDAPGDRMIVYGGATTAGFSTEAWSLSLATGAWTLLAPTGAGPAAQANFGFALDHETRRLLVFGGINSSEIRSRVTWALSLDGPPAWTLVDPGASPLGISHHSAIVDPAGDRMISYGGIMYDSHSGASGDSDKLWSFGLENQRWVHHVPPGPTPGVRWGHTTILDAPRHRMILFGGGTNDVWSLSLATMTWTQLAPTGTAPSARRGHVAVFDAPRDRMVVYGGHDGVGDGAVFTLSLAGAPHWTRYTPAGPGGRAYQGAVYDPPRQRMLLIGNVEYTSPVQVWALDLAAPSPTWTLLAPGGTTPTRPLYWDAIYDPVRDRVIANGNLETEQYQSTEVHELTLSGTPTWSLLATSGSQHPPRANATIVYDAARDRMLHHGGRTFGGGGTEPEYNHEVYELRWTPVLDVPPVAPIARGLRVQPNPAHGPQRIAFDLPAGAGPATVEVFSVAGRRVWHATVDAATRTVQWTGMSRDGGRVPPGVYLVRVSAGSFARSARVVRVE